MPNKELEELKLKVEMLEQNIKLKEAEIAERESKVSVHIPNKVYRKKYNDILEEVKNSGKEI